MTNFIKYDISQDYIKSVIDYNPITGIVTWKRRTDVGKIWNSNYADKKAGTVLISGQINIKINYKAYILSRVIWLYMTGDLPFREIDHIDNDNTNNKWNNLRISTKSQNQGNSTIRRDNTVGFKGVTFNKKLNKYRAQIQRNKIKYHLGVFDTAEEAKAEYDKYSKIFFGEFARSV